MVVKKTNLGSKFPIRKKYANNFKKKQRKETRQLKYPENEKEREWEEEQKKNNNVCVCVCVCVRDE